MRGHFASLAIEQSDFILTIFFQLFLRVSFYAIGQIKFQSLWKISIKFDADAIIRHCIWRRNLFRFNCIDGVFLFRVY